MARCCSAPGSRSSWWISTRVRGSVTSWSRCSASSPIHPSVSILFIVVVTWVLLVGAVAGEQACEVHVGDQELGFPLDKMERQALCRLAGVVTDPTTSHVNPPVVTPVRKAIYDFLLDHMVLTAAVVAQGQLADQRSGQDHVVEQKVIDRFPDRSHNRRVDVAGRGVIDDAGQAAQGLAFHLVERKARFLIADVNLAGLLAGDRADEQHQRHDDYEKDRD